MPIGPEPVGSGGRSPGIRNLPICDRQSEPQCTGVALRPVLPRLAVFGDRRWTSDAWHLEPNAGSAPLVFAGIHQVSSDRGVGRSSRVEPCRTPGATPSGAARDVGPGGMFIAAGPLAHQRRYARDAVVPACRALWSWQAWQRIGALGSSFRGSKVTI